MCAAWPGMQHGLPAYWPHDQLRKAPKTPAHWSVLNAEPWFPAPQEKRQDAERQQQGGRSAETSPTEAGAAPAGQLSVCRLNAARSRCLAMMLTVQHAHGLASSEQVLRLTALY